CKWKLNLSKANAIAVQNRSGKQKPKAMILSHYSQRLRILVKNLKRQKLNLTKFKQNSTPFICHCRIFLTHRFPLEKMNRKTVKRNAGGLRANLTLRPKIMWICVKNVA